MEKNLKEQLIELAEPEYQIFSQGLLPGTEHILGVRLPHLRKIAKTLSKGDWKEYLLHAGNDTFEELMLQGMVIGYAKADYEEIIPYIEHFIPKINNWSVCDSFCTGLKITNKYKDSMWAFLQSYLKDDREYFVRFGIVMLLSYYVEEEYIHDVLKYLNEINPNYYYVQMALAWAVSICYIKYPKQTLPFLLQNSLDDFTYKKALQKITESLRIDSETKDFIRSLRRN